MDSIDMEIRNPDFRRKYRKYYFISEVDAHLAATARAVSRQTDRLEHVNRELEDARKENESLRARLAAAVSEKEELDRQLQVQTSDISALGMQIRELSAQTASKDEQLARQGDSILKLQQSIETLNTYIAELERNNTSTMIEEADRKAKTIISRAIAENDRMMSEAADQRSRTIAASRAAYYNALQFKQELAQHFRQMEQDLNSSIDVLRILENPRRLFPAIPSAEEEEGTPPGGNEVQ